MVDDPRLAPYRLIADPPALKRAGLFAVEGRLAIAPLLASRYRPHSVLVSDAALPQLEPLLAPRADVEVYVAPVAIISALGGFDFHRGALALGYRGEPQPVERVLQNPPSASAGAGALLVLEGISNPDNIGGIFRSACAFNARAVLLGPGCGDPLYRKSIRTSMGAALLVPWAELPSWPDDLRIVTERGYRVIALTTEASAPALDLVLADVNGPQAFLLGSEGYGLSHAAHAAAATAARIPMPRDGADSLNVAAAASIALYEHARRR